MKSIFNNIILLLCISMAMAGCEKYADDYKDYLNNQEIIYPGLARNVHYLPGDRRAVLVWNPGPDPSISKYKITWNNGTDSTIVLVNAVKPDDTIRVSIEGLEEYAYSFKIYAYDKEGHVSVGQEINNVRVYGDKYRATLSNRLVDAAVRDGNDVHVSLLVTDKSSPFSRITYTDVNDGEKIVQVDSNVSEVTLTDFKALSKFSIKSYFLPDTNAIDTFSVAGTEYGVFEDVTSTYIKNAGSPFLRGDNGTGKWGLLKDWSYNSNLLNQDNDTKGGWSWDNSGVIHFESKDWGTAGLNNGKLYQTITLPAGKYATEFYSDGGGGTINGNFVVATGNTLPDISNLNAVVVKHHWDGSSIGGTHAMSFELASETTVSIGWVVSTDLYTWMHVNKIVLKKLSE